MVQTLNLNPVGPGPREPELEALHRAARCLRVRGGRPLHRLDPLDTPQHHTQGQQEPKLFLPPSVFALMEL